jgi:lysophospholipid acyltransferase (LPLAT)-like uncharacterized protein
MTAGASNGARARQARRLPMRRRLKRSGLPLLAHLAEWFYLAYMRLVVATSTIHGEGLEVLRERRRRGVSTILAILHQDFLPAVYLFRGQPVTVLVNAGDAGDILTRIMRACGMHTIRGGSSSRSSRRIPALKALVEDLRTRSAGGGILCVTPDGSKGPAGACKPGIVALSMQTHTDIVCVRVHARRAYYLPTWDRSCFPLPFGEIWVEAAAPLPPPNVRSREAMERTRQAVESTLHAMHQRAFGRCQREPVPALERLHAAAATQATSGASAATPESEPEARAG